MTTIRTELPIATEPWERARSLFLEQLDPHERTLFEQADLNTIYHEASVSHRQHQQSSKLQGARRRLAPLVDAIDGYGKGLDVMSNTPVAAAFLCPIWGGIRVALYIAQETEKYFEKLSEMLEKIGRTLPLFRDYQNLFKDHERLLQVLSEAYLNVLRFCTDVTALFKEAKTRAVSVVSMTVSCKTLWRPFTLRFEEYLKNFKDLKQQVQDEANVAHMIESKRERKLQERNRALAETRLREEKLRQTLQRFSPIDYHLTHRRLRSECHQGTTQWIFDHDSYKTWREIMESSSIHCNGIPGSGKTILASSIVESLIADPVDPSHLVCFYYCDYADHRTLDPAIMLGTFVRQILERSHHAEGLREWVLNQWADRNSSPLAQELLPAILDAFERFEHVTMVIDALDELSPHDQHECGNIISTFLSLRGCRVSVFLSCRFEAIVLNKVPQPRFSIALSPGLLSNDICRIVEDMVQEKIKSKDLTVQDPALQQEISSKLQEGAEDMFLWVKFQITELCECMNDRELRRTLENLPRDLAGTYRRILDKISTNGHNNVNLARQAFRWIVCAKRPLTIEELIEAVILEEGDKSFPADRIPTDGGTRLRLACGNLVVFDEKHRFVRLAHHTVKQFFIDWPKDYGVLVDLSFRFTFEEAELQIYKLCLAYLCFSDFETQVTRLDSNAPKISEGDGFIPSLINYMLPESGIVGRLIALLYGRSRTTNSLNKCLKVQVNNLHVSRENKLKQKYSLLGYVSSWWCFHCPTGEFPPSAPSKSILERTKVVVFEKNFGFSHRPWNNVSFRGDSQSFVPQSMLIFRWAARTGKFAFWEILVDHQKYFRDAMLNDNEERDLLADILHGGCGTMLESYFEALRGKQITRGIPACIICRALRLSPKSRHAAFFAKLYEETFPIVRGPPVEIHSSWRRESTSTFWFGNPWPSGRTKHLKFGGGSFLLEEAVKQDDTGVVQSILENTVGEVVYFGSRLFKNRDESPLARAAYGNNFTMVEVLFSYINGTAPFVSATVEKFDLEDIYLELESRNLVSMIDHIRRLSRSGIGYTELSSSLGYEVIAGRRSSS